MRSFRVPRFHEKDPAPRSPGCPSSGWVAGAWNMPRRGVCSPSGRLGIVCRAAKSVDEMALFG